MTKSETPELDVIRAWRYLLGPLTEALCHSTVLSINVSCALPENVVAAKALRDVQMPLRKFSEAMEALEAGPPQPPKPEET